MLATRHNISMNKTPHSIRTAPPVNIKLQPNIHQHDRQQDDRTDHKLQQPLPMKNMKEPNPKPIKQEEQEPTEEDSKEQQPPPGNDRDTTMYRNIPNNDGNEDDDNEDDHSDGIKSDEASSMHSGRSTEEHNMATGLVDSAILDSQLGPYDVICGRQSVAFNNCGNRRFRMTIANHVDAYTAMTGRHRKGVFIGHLVQSIITTSGARFYKWHPTTQQLTELTERQVRAKVGHALRDMAAFREAAQQQQQQQQQQGKPENVQEPKQEQPTITSSSDGTTGPSRKLTTPLVLQQMEEDGQLRRPTHPILSSALNLNLERRGVATALESTGRQTNNVIDQLLNFTPTPATMSQQQQQQRRVSLLTSVTSHPSSSSNLDGQPPLNSSNNNLTASFSFDSLQPQQQTQHDYRTVSQYNADAIRRIERERTHNTMNTNTGFYASMMKDSFLPISMNTTSLQCPPSVASTVGMAVAGRKKSLFATASSNANSTNRLLKRRYEEVRHEDTGSSAAHHNKNRRMSAKVDPDLFDVDANGVIVKDPFDDIEFIPMENYTMHTNYFTTIKENQDDENENENEI